MRNQQINGMVVAPGGDHAIMVDPENGHFGWTFRRHPDGQWISARKATGVEMQAANHFAKHTGQAMLAASPMPAASEDFPQDFAPWPDQPVPPAVDVEVLACASFSKSGNIQCWSLQRDHASLRKLEGEGQTVIELVDRAHVTRLTAERDGLLAAADKRLEWAKEASARIDALENELTKARELITDIRGADRAYATQKIDTYLAHQSAPAAKGDL